MASLCSVGHSTVTALISYRSSGLWLILTVLYITTSFNMAHFSNVAHGYVILLVRWTDCQLKAELTQVSAWGNSIDLPPLAFVWDTRTETRSWTLFLYNCWLHKGKYTILNRGQMCNQRTREGKLKLIIGVLTPDRTVSWSVRCKGNLYFTGPKLIPACPTFLHVSCFVLQHNLTIMELAMWACGCPCVCVCVCVCVEISS